MYLHVSTHWFTFEIHNNYMYLCLKITGQLHAHLQISPHMLKIYVLFIMHVQLVMELL